jgi:hypothetical protein
MKFRFEKFWLFIFVFCTVNTILIQLIIRPNYVGEIFALEYLLGVTPNFFPAIGIPSLFVLSIHCVKRKNCFWDYVIKKKYVFGNLFSMVGLILWELIQSSFDLIFDWDDILWTLIGAFSFYFIWCFSPKNQN